MEIKDKAQVFEPLDVTEWFEAGWDNGVEQFTKVFGRNFWTRLYWYGYKFAENGDVDGGACFKIREDAVQHLIKLGEEIQRGEDVYRY